MIVQRDRGVNTGDRVSVKWCGEQMMRCGTVVDVVSNREGDRSSVLMMSSE